MRQFYVLNRVLVIGIFTLLFFSCEQEEEFIITESIDKEDAVNKVEVPNLNAVQRNLNQKHLSKNSFRVLVQLNQQ
ncbi:hypothetical protein [Leeuwenhoekiella sp. MAR_2009_132]|uniref:hypothetical protein n=1 Tax=Leeuwenhoekiella sp. MAR_2009_132 TaxID=1392489 RepID=UPI00048D3B66|nr:hypothetical protein [Leeuwenhoekiella sp. MAR_2009_132]